METIEIQLISSLIRSLVSSTSDYDMVFKSLIRLPQIQVITNYFINYFTKTQEKEIKKKIILLYFKYVNEKREQISQLNGSLLFDHFKHLVCETPLFDSIDEYVQFSSTLTFYIQNLKTFSESSLYQSIIDWSNDNTNIALFSLSEVYKNYFGRCLSNIVSNYSQKMPIIVSLSLLLSKHKIELIDQTAADFFNEQNVTSKIRESIQICFNSDQPQISNNATENKRLGFFLIESIFHFLKETDSCQFYISISDMIFSVFDKCDDSIQKVALKAFCELPVIDDDERISVTKQLATVISAFGNKITDFDSDLSNQLINFTDKRIKNEEINLKETIRPLFSVQEQFNGACLLACRYDLVKDFDNLIFMGNVTDKLQALSACYCIEYLNSHQKISENLISLNSIKTFLSAASIQNIDSEFEEKISNAFEILIQKFEFNKVVKTVFENILLLLNSQIIDKIIDIFMKFCKEKDNSFSSIEKVSDDEFIENIFPFLMKFAISPVESQFYISFIFILIFISSVKTGVFKSICELIDAPLSLVFEELIPSECQPKILEKALTIFNTIEEDNKENPDKNETKLDDLYNLNMNQKDLQSASSLIIISFKCCEKSDIQINVAKSFISKDSFNECLFEIFFSSITYIKSDESINFFASIVLNKEEENNNNNNSLTSFFFKKSPFLKSFFFQQSGLSTKFSKQSIINTLSYISSLNMNSSSLSKLFSIFFETYELNPKSRAVLLSLSKQHKKCELSDKLIQFVISSDYFVEAIPDFLYEIEQINESILQKAFKTYFDFGDENNFDLFCQSSFKNYSNDNCFSTISTSLLQVRDVYKMMKFGICLSKYHSNNSELIPKLTIQFAMNILSNDDQLRILCQKSLFILYLIKTHINNNNDNIEEFNKQNFESSIQITSLPFNESVLKCCQFFDEIANSDLFNQYYSKIIEIICTISPIELPIAILSLSICKKHFETKNFILYLTKEGNISNNNNALIKHLINQALIVSIEHDFETFMKSIVATDMSNQFTRDFISFQMKSSEKNHDLLIKFAFSQFLTSPNLLMSDSDVENGKFQLFAVLCSSNNIELRKNDDFLLIWLASIVLVNMNRSSKQISLIVRRDGRIGLSDSLKQIFGRLNFECPSIDDRDISLAETFSKKIAQFVFSLTNENITSFINCLKEIDLKKGALSDITIVVIFILSHLLKFFIQIEKKENEKSFIPILTDLIYQLSATLKDDACRVVSAKFASLFTVDNLKFFPEEGRNNLLIVALRSLITPETATQNSCIIFLSMILAVSPSDSIVKQKTKLLDAITRCFDLKKVVGIEILLDSIQSIISVDPDVEPFNNMGLISIPWFLILSVNESELIRTKSSKILLDLSGSNSSSNQKIELENDVDNCYTQIVNGFIQKLGVDVMIVFGNFLIDWSSKNGFNNFSMKLILKIATAIKKSENKSSTQKFINKTVPALMPIVNGSSDQLQSSAIEILSVLME